MHVEGSLPANLCLVSLLSLKQRSTFERFCLQHIQMVNKTFSLKRLIIIDITAEASRVDPITVWCLSFPHSRPENPVTNSFWANNKVCLMTAIFSLDI